MAEDQFIPEIVMGRPYDKDDEWEPWEYGAHARGHNDSSMGIALIGNFDEEEPPWQMLMALDIVLTLSCRQFNVAWNQVYAAILGHGEAAATACPGRYVDMDEVRESVSHTLTGMM